MTDDLIGKKFWRLTPIRLARRVPVGRRGALHKIYECLCDCGETREVGRCHIGRQKSCGCLQREVAATRAGRGWVTVFSKDYKRNARARGREWLLTREQVEALALSPCHYCGARPVARRLNHYTVAVNGIDRFDNALGYTADNTVPCCFACNVAKLDRTAEEFLSWVRRIVEHQDRNSKGR